MKLIDDLNLSQIHANSKLDYVFDLHIAQKHNAKQLKQFASDLTKYIKQVQPNEFFVSPTDIDGVTTEDSGLITVAKAGLVYEVSTSYEKEFSMIQCYNPAGELVTTGFSLSFPVVGGVIDKTVAKITFASPLTQQYRLVIN